MDGLLQIEARMPEATESDMSSYHLLQARLQTLCTENQVPECRHEPMSVDKLREFIHDEYDRNAPFTDIPHLPRIEYSDDELQLWSALIANYRDTALKVPRYTNIMVWSGVPPPLRGMAWRAMCESHSHTFESLYDSLAAEWTPFVKIIGRDLNRTFPEIGLFQEKGGEGQVALGRVLRAYSAYDMQVGYCQGLTFLAGPLLLHMSDRDAFCVLVRLMEDYDLRSMFTADMAGLQLRIYQFEFLFKHYLPELHSHFEALGVNSIYASQWFLSFFAVTCPLSILVRIYDLMFAEGAIPTLMRVALAALKRNQVVLMDYDDEEQILQHLLGRNLWDMYGYDADLLVSGVNSFGPDLLERLQSLEDEYMHRGGQLARAKSRSKERTGRGTRFLSGISSWVTNNASAQVSTTTLSSNSTDCELTRSNSIGSYDSDSTAATSVTSFQSSPLDDMQKKLDALQRELQHERMERLKDRELVSVLLKDLDDNSDGLEAHITQVRLRFGLDEQNSASDCALACSSGNGCRACEQYLMELATARTNEALARQEIDELSDRLRSLQPPSLKAVEPTANGKRWGLW
uniref:ARAD1A17226p n=1 Tax=Blastobotrys adeninivorans TaxID=409370 RepID=A0A060SZ41_BLAAD